MCLWLFQLGDYHNLCFISDVLLLADVFENLGNVFLKAYNLIPATCTAVLLYAGKPVSNSMANVELELLNYPDVTVLVHWKRRSRCYFWNQKCTTFKLLSYRKQLSEYLYLGNATVLKLVPNLQNKTNYVVHYRNLISYIFTIGRGVVWSWARSTEC